MSENENRLPSGNDTLSRRMLLEVFDEADAPRRRAAIAEIFTQDARFTDHFGTHVGHGEIDAAVEALHGKLPGFRFGIIGEPQVLDGAARLAWQFGPPSEPDKITGTDTILIRDGRVSVLLVFLDPATN